MVLEKIKCKLQYALPHHFLSRVVAKLADCKIPRVKNWLIKNFITYYKIDLNSAKFKELKDYPTFNHFFIRELDIKARPVATGKDEVACPADGVVSQAGSIQNDVLFQAKGHTFRLAELLGGKNELAKNYEHGQFVTIYLAPHDYHRVHMPLDGQLLKTIYIPGQLFSVNNRSVEHIPNLFCRNERLVCLFKTQIGEIALIMVGAMLVAGIETVWGQRETPCQSQRIVVKDYQERNINLIKGEEVGRFRFGSTVILLFPANEVALMNFGSHQHVHMGSLIGHVINQKKVSNGGN